MMVCIGRGECRTRREPQATYEKTRQSSSTCRSYCEPGEKVYDIHLANPEAISFMYRNRYQMAVDAEFILFEGTEKSARAFVIMWRIRASCSNSVQAELGN
jgi:hypothetical protein